MFTLFISVIVHRQVCSLGSNVNHIFWDSHPQLKQTFRWAVHDALLLSLFSTGLSLHISFSHKREKRPYTGIQLHNPRCCMQDCLAPPVTIASVLYAAGDCKESGIVCRLSEALFFFLLPFGLMTALYSTYHPVHFCSTRGPIYNSHSDFIYRHVASRQC